MCVYVLLYYKMYKYRIEILKCRSRWWSHRSRTALGTDLVKFFFFKCPKKCFRQRQIGKFEKVLLRLRQQSREALCAVWFRFVEWSTHIYIYIRHSLKNIRLPVRNRRTQKDVFTRGKFTMRLTINRRYNQHWLKKN